MGKPPDEYIVDLKRLRRWLREMENQLSQFPTISVAIQMKEFELEKLQKKNAVSFVLVNNNWFNTGTICPEITLIKCIVP